jgi:hypothetical protein
VQASLAKSSSLFPDTINLGFFYKKKPNDKGVASEKKDGGKADDGRGDR